MAVRISSPEATLLWRLEKLGHTLDCFVRLLPDAMDVSVYFDGNELFGRTLQTEAEVYEEARIAREERLAEGWIPAATRDGDREERSPS